MIIHSNKLYFKNIIMEQYTECQASSLVGARNIPRFKEKLCY